MEVTVRLSAEHLKDLRAAAKKRNVSAQNLARQILRTWTDMPKKSRPMSFPPTVAHLTSERGA